MDELFEKYRKRLRHIGFFKSVMLSLALALIFGGVIAVATWVGKIPPKITACLVSGFVILIFLMMTALLYFKIFRPTDKFVAKKLDELGFEERYITMYEFSGSNLSMARLQREDAKKKLEGVSEKRLKFTLALPIIFMLAFGFLFTAGATTASVLAVGSVESTPISSPTEEPTKTFTVKYLVYEEGTGRIDGDAEQTVEEGKYTSPVMAIAADGCKFVAWVDENKNYLVNQTNPRFEVNVKEDMTIYALFTKISSDTDGDDHEGEGSEGEDHNKNPEEGDDGDEGDSGDTGNTQGGGASGGVIGDGHENNKVIDGTQDYKDNFDREQLEKELNDKNIPDELKDILGDYYDTLKP